MLGGVDMQTEFAAALRSQANGVPCCLKGAAQGRAERRFAVYRNTVAAGLIEALAGRFPVVERLVGEDFFRAMAHAYVTQEPPRSPLLFQYGGSFADFIAGFAPAAPLPYLRDMARLEYAQGLAYHAADRRTAAACLVCRPGSRAPCRFQGRTAPFGVHCRLVAIPVISIWLANQAETVTPLRHRGAEAALVSRPFLDVETRRLQPGTDAFLSALQASARISEAVRSGGCGIAELQRRRGARHLDRRQYRCRPRRRPISRPKPLCLVSRSGSPRRPRHWP